MLPATIDTAGAPVNVTGIVGMATGCGGAGPLEKTDAGLGVLRISRRAGEPAAESLEILEVDAGGLRRGATAATAVVPGTGARGAAVPLVRDGVDGRKPFDCDPLREIGVSLVAPLPEEREPAAAVPEVTPFVEAGPRAVTGATTDVFVPLADVAPIAPPVSCRVDPFAPTPLLDVVALDADTPAVAAEATVDAAVTATTTAWGSNSMRPGVDMTFK